MAEIEKKVTQLDAATSITDDDVLYVVNDPSGTPASKKITVANMAASATQRGFVELATTAEAQAGVDTARAVTPAGVAAYHQQPITIGVGGGVEGDLTLASLRDEDWHLYIDEVDWNGHPNTLLYLGYNRKSTGTWDDGSVPSIGIAFEADYWPNLVDHFAEWYIEYRAGDGSTKRPFQSSVHINDNTIRNFITGTIDFYSSVDGSYTIQIGDGGSITLWQSNYILKDLNNSQFLRQKNAAGTGYQDIFLNSADQWVMGTITMYGDIWFNHNTNHGPILIDRATAALRRVICTNGVLSTEAV